MVGWKIDNTLMAGKTTMKKMGNRNAINQCVLLAQLRKILPQ